MPTCDHRNLADFPTSGFARIFWLSMNEPIEKGRFTKLRSKAARATTAGTMTKGSDT